MVSLTRAAIILALTAGLAGPAGAQVETRFGIQVGGNLSRLSYDGPDSDDVEMKLGVGFQGGVVARIGEGRLSFMPGAVLTQQSFTTEVNWGAGDKTIAKGRITYLQLPLLAMFRPRVEDYPGETAPFFFAGPAVAHQVSCTERFSFIDFGELDGTSESDCTDFEGRSEKTRTVASFIIGAGIERGALFLSVQYDHGLTNLMVDATDNESVKGRTVSLVLRYFFGDER